MFCHQCGSRTTCNQVAESLVCGTCGAMEGVEMTDGRLPLISSPSSSSGERWSPARASSPAQAMRVESVTVVAGQQPEDGSLMLRVLPNIVPRQANSFFGPEDPDGPPEPACTTFLAGLHARPHSLQAGEASTCAICTDHMELGAPVITLSCGHPFHEDCLRQWLARRHTCPICRLELEVDDVRFLRCMGLSEEADNLERTRQEKEARELQKQTASRRRWVESLRSGMPVHFGLTCGQCAAAPLVGESWCCTVCVEGYNLCSECFAAHEALRLLGGDEPGADAREVPAPHPQHHTFTPVGNAVASCSSAVSASRQELAIGPGGMLTVLVPASSRTADAGPVMRAEASGSGDDAMTAADMALAAVQSLARAR